MPSTYTTNLGIEKIATGEQSGTWGTTTNTNLDLIDEAVNGVEQVTLAAAGSSGSPNDLPISNGSSSDGRNKFIEFIDGGDLGGTAYVQLTPNDAEKVVHIRNSLSAARNIIIFQGTYNASNDFEIPNGADVVLKFDGAGAGAVVSDVNVNLTPTKLTTADLVATTADINGGSVDGATLGTNSAITEAQIDNININGNTISSTDTNGNIALTPDGTGEVDISKVDIDGGSIDGATIGGSTPAAGTFTGLTVGDGHTMGDDVNDNFEISSSSGENLILNAGAGNILFESDGSESARFDNSGRLLIGHTPSLTQYASQSNLQVVGDGFDASTVALRRDSTNANPPGIVFAKSRSSSIGDNTVVQDDDQIGALIFVGADGTDLTTRAAEIDVEIDGTPGSNDMPGRLVFRTTADGGLSPTERMRIDNDGKILIGSGATSSGNADVVISNPQSATDGTYYNSFNANNFRVMSYNAGTVQDGESAVMTIEGWGSFQSYKINILVIGNKSGSQNDMFVEKNLYAYTGNSTQSVIGSSTVVDVANSQFATTDLTFASSVSPKKLTVTLSNSTAGVATSALTFIVTVYGRASSVYISGGSVS